MVFIKFSLLRLYAIIIKEIVQIKRDRTTLAMIIGIPALQVILFGFAINTNPKNLPTALHSFDQSYHTRAFIQAMDKSDYFRFTHQTMREKQAEDLLKLGKVLFVVNIPPNFTKDMIQGETPQILVETDATDPIATSAAVQSLQNIGNDLFNQELVGLARESNQVRDPFEIVIHNKYNPDEITSLNIVSALVGVVLTLTLVIITAIAITRERERGTMESLLATPVQPIEVMIGKIIPYVVIGFIQLAVILGVANYVFDVPIANKLFLTFFASVPFIVANLAVGLSFSTMASNQLQAVQLSMLIVLPSILLSGFMFPFYGMPVWAQWLGNGLPLTHYVVAMRGILLKDFDFILVNQAIWPIIVFATIVILVGLARFRRTLD